MIVPGLVSCLDAVQNDGAVVTEHRIDDVEISSCQDLRSYNPLKSLSYLNSDAIVRHERITYSKDDSLHPHNIKLKVPQIFNMRAVLLEYVDLERHAARQCMRRACKTDVIWPVGHLDHIYEPFVDDAVLDEALVRPFSQRC